MSEELFIGKFLCLIFMSMLRISHLAYLFFCTFSFNRDIKPSNIMCRTRNDFEKVSVGVKCVLGDFSSAWDDFSSENFYSKGPSAAEQTVSYCKLLGFD